MAYALYHDKIYNSVHPAMQGYRMLQFTLALLPIITGIDKFFNVAINWTVYLTPGIPALINVAPSTIMYLAGIIEIIVGLLVALRPQVGAYAAAIWFGVIVVNIFMLGVYYDVALSAAALGLAALALGRLSSSFEEPIA